MEKLMSNLDNAHRQDAPSPPASGSKRSDGFLSWRRTILVGGTLMVGVVFGAGSLAYAGMAAGRLGWHHGPKLEHIQQIVRRSLDSVGATTAQEDKIHDIVAAGFAAVVSAPEDRQALRKQMLDLLRAPNVDRAAIEKLRADEVAQFDTKSKALVGILLDATDQLTPEQRVKLVDRATEMMQHGPRRRWEGPNDDAAAHGMHRSGDDVHGPDGQDHGSGENPD
jgi:periplasmic protein CpxP/Spy